MLMRFTDLGRAVCAIRENELRARPGPSPSSFASMPPDRTPTTSFPFCRNLTALLASPRAPLRVPPAQMALDHVRHRSNLPHGTSKLVLRHAKLLAPVPQFVVLVNVDPLPVACAANVGVVSHRFSFSEGTW